MMNKTKRAEIVLEEVIAIGLSVVVLFLILSMFGNNLSKMLQNSSLNKAMNGDQSKKTSWETFDKNPTKTQVNVQIVADQASLAWYHSQAQQQIEKLAAITTPLTDQQTIDLAKYLTIFAESGNSVPYNELRDNSVENKAYLLMKNTNTGVNRQCTTSTSYSNLACINGITIDSNNTFKTSVLTTKGKKDYNWSKDKKNNANPNKGAIPGYDEIDRINNVKVISEIFD